MPDPIDDDPCAGVNQLDARANLLILTHPAVKFDDATLREIRAMTYPQKVALLRPPGVVIAGVGDAPTPLPSTTQDLLALARSDLDRFTASVLTYFEGLARPDVILPEEYCAVINLLVYEKLRDIAAYEAIAQGGYNDAPPLECACASVLLAAHAAQYLESVPLTFVTHADDVEMRLIPYAPLLYISVNDRELVAGNVILPSPMFAILHEVAHYLFWNGKANETDTFEVWALKQLRPHYTDPEQLEEAYRKFEESFCDLVAVAIGGPHAAITLSRVVIYNQGDGADYVIDQVRGSSILYALEVLYPDWQKPIQNAGGNLFTYDNLNDPILQVVRKESLQTFLSELKTSAADYDAIWWFQDRAKGIAGAGGVTNELALHHDWDSDIEHWLRWIEGKLASPTWQDSAEGLQVASLPIAQNIPTAGSLIEKWKGKDKTELPGRYAERPWFAVAQAGGWSDRGTKTNIGT